MFKRINIESLLERIENLEKRVKQLECNHSEKEYGLTYLSSEGIRYYEVGCKRCGTYLGRIDEKKKVQIELAKLKKQKKELESRLKEIK